MPDSSNCSFVVRSVRPEKPKFEPDPLSAIAEDETQSPGRARKRNMITRVSSTNI